MPEAITLDYRKAPLRWRRWVWRSVWLVLLLAIVGAGWYWRGTISRHVMAWYWMRQCLAYSPPPGKVMWEKDTVEASKLQAAAPNEYVLEGPVRKLWARAEVRCWDELQRGRPGPLGFFDIIFMHERTGRGPGGGQKRLVRVLMSAWQAQGSSVNIYAASHRINSIFSIPDVAGEYTNGPENIEATRIYAGQPDPKDDSHFTVEYVTPAGSRVMVDGWLEADDSITLKVGPTMAPTTRP